jgi:hypothetical protein
MARQFKVPVNLVSLTTDPSTASAGDIYYNSATSFIRLYTTTAGWQNVGGSGGGGGGGGGGTINHTHNYDGSVVVGSGGSLVTTATFGAGIPNNVLGLDGDVYIDTTNLNIYLKNAGVWGSPTEINAYTKEEVDTLLSDIGNSLGDYVPLSQVNQPDGVPATDPNGNILVPTVLSANGAGLKFRDNTIQTTAITPAMLEDIEVLALAAL